MNCLSDTVLDTEYDESKRVWVILNKDDLDHYLYFPLNEKNLGLWAFLKKEDAIHLAKTIKEIAPAYKEIDLVVTEDRLKDIREGGKENETQICVLTPIDSLEFFKRYEETLGKYYGF